MVDYPAISRIDDPANVRVMLLQGKQQVNAPLMGLGFQLLSANLTSWAAIARAAGFDTFVVTPSSANLAALVTDETGTGALVFGTSPTIATPVLTLKQSVAPTPTAEGAIEFDTDQDRIVIGDGTGQAIFGQVTPWVTYTPTFTGLGTVININIWSRRIGDALQLQGRFTTGTPTAVEARMTLGFNGTNANVTSDTSKIPTIRLSGSMARNTVSAAVYFVFMEGNVGYVTFGFSDAATAGFGKQLGNGMAGAAQTFTLLAEIPISGW